MKTYTKKISCYMIPGSPESTLYTARLLKENQTIQSVSILQSAPVNLPDIGNMGVDGLKNTAALKEIAKHCTTPYVLLSIQPHAVEVGEQALKRFIAVAEDTEAVMLYSDYYQLEDGKNVPHATIDYQDGSLRDDFNFGGLLFIRADAFKKVVSEMTVNYRYAALYDLRLQLAAWGKIYRIPEFLYTTTLSDSREFNERMFDYVNPKNREVQIEMENACTHYLKQTAAWLLPEFCEINIKAGEFPVEATVVIPVKNRERTIADAILSALKQKTTFPFNIIVVDNYSSDETTHIVKKLAGQYPEVIHIIPERTNLGIGGCWNRAVNDASCGRFCVQLDSDDLYIDTWVLQHIVTAFYEQDAAAVIGAYRMVNFELEEMPPGIIDHREWTPDNGRNNALRINGLGAPRAFYTPLIREITFPDTSYGEDYAVMLAISRLYRIGRIYEPLYLCRRWDDNSDASLDLNKENNYNFYKDRLRTIEIYARRQFNRKSNHYK